MTADDYHLGRKPRPIGPPLPLGEYSRRCEVDLPKPDDPPMRARYDLSMLRCWRRYVGQLSGGETCACGDVAEACGGARGRCRHFGAPPGPPPVPPTT